MSLDDSLLPKDEYVTFRKFNDKEEAIELIELLRQHNIRFLEETATGFDITFADSDSVREYVVKIHKEDFERADLLLEQSVEEQISNVDKDYYLYGFSDDELTEVIAKKDEWSSFDYLLAQKILRERGKEISEFRKETFEQERLKELSKPESKQTGWIYFGYICALLGGWLGMFIGWHLSNHKRTLPNGEQIYGYLEPDRVHGNRILVLGVICFILWVLAGIWYIVERT